LKAVVGWVQLKGNNRGRGIEMNVKQVWGMAGGFLFVYIVITLTNKPQVPSKTEQTAIEQAPADNGAIVSHETTGAGAPSFGFCLPGLGAETLASAETDALLGRMAARGSWVAISPVLFQENGFASEVAGDAAQSPSQASIAHAIDQCRLRGLKVVLRPVVVAKDGTRRERFVPADPNAWFQSYSRAIAPYVDLAARSQVEVFSLGANYAQLEAGQPWPALIKQVRERYTGRLTYGAGTQSESGNGGYQAVPFWGELDYVGVEASAPSGAQTGADDDARDSAWRQFGEDLGTWMTERQPGRQVFFTSVGFMPNATPTDIGSGYRAFTRAMADRAWMAGANWYQWDAAIEQPEGAPEGEGPKRVEGDGMEQDAPPAIGNETPPKQIDD
jgi:hypothetical protein